MDSYSFKKARENKKYGLEVDVKTEYDFIVCHHVSFYIWKIQIQLSETFSIN